MKSFAQWLQRKWQPPPKESDLLDTMALVFGTEHGRHLLNYWLDTIYCSVCVSNDPLELAAHNAQRAVIHDILQKLDQHAHPAKYEAKEPEHSEMDARLM